MMTADRTFYSWSTVKNEKGTFDAVVKTWDDTSPTVELKRIPCATRARAKTHAIKWCRYLAHEHKKAAA
jgi:hypothetical protein